jgi:DNA-directed RNA polymerase subunit RPC12/RpoP
MIDQLTLTWQRLRVFLCPCLLIFLAASLFAQGDAEPKKKDPQEYHQSFKGLAEPPPGWEFYGPDAKTFVKFEPEGMRLTLPRGHPGHLAQVGLRARIAVEGDFDFVVSFEILKEPEPADAGKDQTRFTLDVVLDAPHHDVATLSRRVSVSGGHQFFPWMRVWDAPSGKPQQRGKKGYPAKAKTGRLRMVRTGSDLSCFVSEGADEDFTLLQKSPFSADTSIEVRFVGTTGGEKAALDVRLTGLTARAEKLTGLPEAALDRKEGGQDPLAANRHQTDRRGWLAAALVIGLAIALAFAVAVGTWLYLRQRRGATEPAAVREKPADSDAASPSVSFACSDCGKKLKAKAEMAGKKVKCSQCGMAVLVPSLSR